MNTFNVKNKTAVLARFISLVTAAILLLFVLCCCKQDNTAHIIVLAGQSNCEGVSSCKEPYKYISEEKRSKFEQGIDNVNIVLNTNGVTVNEFEKCRFGMGTSPEYFGIELGIADYLNENYPDKQFYLVKRAHGGTSVFPFWHAPESDGSQGMYLKALCEKLDCVIEELKNQGKRVILEAFCWMQGEQDATSAETVATYSHYLSNMAAYFRQRYAEYNSGEIKFVDCGISKYDLTEPYYYREINDIKRNFSLESESNCFIENDEKLNLTLHLEPSGNPDLIHYDSYAMLRLGRKFGETAYFG